MTYSPFSNETIPPPDLEHSSIAFWIAFVAFVVPSGLAPNEFTEKIFLRFGSLRVPVLPAEVAAAFLNYVTGGEITAAELAVFSGAYESVLADGRSA